MSPTRRRFDVTDLGPVLRTLLDLCIRNYAAGCRISEAEAEEELFDRIGQKGLVSYLRLRHGEAVVEVTG